jgi:hypothetical protein
MSHLLMINHPISIKFGLFLLTQPTSETYHIKIAVTIASQYLVQDESPAGSSSSDTNGQH